MKRLLGLCLILLIMAGCGREETGKFLFKDDFESGPASTWDGGVVQKDMTYKNSNYALKGVYKDGGFVYLEKWKKIPVTKNTKLSFAYYCRNVNDLVINFWSPSRKRNYSLTIHNPSQDEWTVVTQSLEDYTQDHGNAINSIHFAVPNREGVELYIDNITLSN